MLHGLCSADLVAQLLASVIHFHAEASLVQNLCHAVCVCSSTVSDGQYLDLNGSQPCGESTAEMLGDDADEPFDGA